MFFTLFWMGDLYPVIYGFIQIIFNKQKKF